MLTLFASATKSRRVMLTSKPRYSQIRNPMACPVYCLHRHIVHAGSSLTRAHKPASQSSSHLHNPTQSNSPSSPPYTSPQSPEHTIPRPPRAHPPGLPSALPAAPGATNPLRLRLLRQLYPQTPPVLRFSRSQLQPPQPPS
ncbi:hypothetical protein L208DRAFT_268715 [Tricholoma matsutake]|nr:hypothetical protein L208DRAFT_268715 [Tricholoma matsutake 945]